MPQAQDDGARGGGIDRPADSVCPGFGLAEAEQEQEQRTLCPLAKHCRTRGRQNHQEVNLEAAVAKVRGRLFEWEGPTEHVGRDEHPEHQDRWHCYGLGQQPSHKEKNARQRSEEDLDLPASCVRMIMFFVGCVARMVSEECGEPRTNSLFVRDFSLELDPSRSIGRHIRFNDARFSQKPLA